MTAPAPTYPALAQIPAPIDAVEADEWERDSHGQITRGWCGVETHTSGGDCWVDGIQHTDGSSARRVTIVYPNADHVTLPPAEARATAVGLRALADAIDVAASAAAEADRADVPVNSAPLPCCNSIGRHSPACSALALPAYWWQHIDSTP